MKHFSILLLAFFITVSIYAQPGTVDKSYGVNNTGTMSVQKALSITSSAMQPDNKLVLGISFNSSATSQYALTRHNTDGSIDTIFGSKGQTIISIDDLVENALYDGGLNAAAIQPDSRIVAIGNITNNAFNGSVLIVRVLPDGTPDESFGSHGRIITNLDFTTVVTSVTVQTDGKILVCGYQYKDLFNVRGDILIRYNPDGTLDKTFGKYEGYTSYDEIGGSRDYALLLQPDGKIITGGSSGGKFLLVRYLPNGIVDKSFGIEGAVKTAFTSVNGGAQINDIALDEKSRISATGTIGSNEGVGVVRYLPDGTSDNSFDQDGQEALSFNGFSYTYVTGNKVLAQANGKLIIHSVIAGQNDVLYRTLLSALNEDGSLDSSFGTDKGQTIFNSAYADDISSDAAMQSDNKIIVSGNMVDDNFNSIGYSLTRFNGYPVHVSLAVRIKRWLQNHTLSWRGLPAEDKIGYYSVEQSSNATRDFTPIIKVSGRNNLKDYSITNSHLLNGANYYRIKAVSTDGVVRYSEVVSADNTANTTSIYPNPAKSYVTVQGLKKDETTNISIADGAGNVKARGVSTSTQYQSSVSNLQPGTYYVNITTKTKTETLKFVKE